MHSFQRQKNASKCNLCVPGFVYRQDGNVELSVRVRILSNRFPKFNKKLNP